MHVHMYYVYMRGRICPLQRGRVPWWGAPHGLHMRGRRCRLQRDWISGGERLVDGLCGCGALPHGGVVVVDQALALLSVLLLPSRPQAVAEHLWSNTHTNL